MKKSDQDKQPTWRRTLIEWGAMGTIALVIYAMGWHTEVIGTMQRGLLWTGLFDADTSQITTTDGPVLSDSDYQFEMRKTTGGTISLDDFRGDVVFVNVWASWCPPCVAEMPTITTLYNNVGNKDNIRFILLSMDEEPQKAVNFMKGKDFPMPYYFPASSLPPEFQSQYLPTTFVISKEGQIVYKKEGIADYSSPNFALWLRELAQK